jgi:hypothetical protein
VFLFDGGIRRLIRREIERRNYGRTVRYDTRCLDVTDTALVPGFTAVCSWVTGDAVTPSSNKRDNAAEVQRGRFYHYFLAL